MSLLQEEMNSAMIDEGGSVISPLTGLPVPNHPFNNNRFDFVSNTNEVIYDRNLPKSSFTTSSKKQGLSSLVSRGVSFASPSKKQPGSPVKGAQPNSASSKTVRNAKK
jgi:hypothetical protein